MTPPRLIVLAGAPGVGKTTIGRRVADALMATYLRVDSVEAAVARSLGTDDVGAAGYAVAHAVALDQLGSRRPVVVDAVNAVQVARDGWVALAASAPAVLTFVEIICSDAAEHRRRVESRVADLAGHRVPDWADVAARAVDPWREPRLVLDNLGSADAAVAELLERLG